MATRNVKISTRFGVDYQFDNTTALLGTGKGGVDIKFPSIVLDFDRTFFSNFGRGNQDNQQMLNALIAAEKYNLYRVKGYSVTLSANQEVGVAQSKPNYSWLLSTTQDEDDALGTTEENGAARAVDYMRNHPRTKSGLVWKKYFSLNYPRCDCDGATYNFESIFVKGLNNLVSSLYGSETRATPSLPVLLAPDSADPKWGNWYFKTSSAPYQEDAADLAVYSLDTVNWFNLFRKKRDINTFLLMNYKVTNATYDNRWKSIGREDLTMQYRVDAVVAHYPRRLFLLPTRNCFSKNVGNQTLQTKHVVRVNYTITMHLEFSDPRRFVRPTSALRERWMTDAVPALTRSLKRTTDDITGLDSQPEDSEKGLTEEVEELTRTKLPRLHGDTTTKLIAPDPTMFRPQMYNEISLTTTELTVPSVTIQ